MAIRIAPKAGKKHKKITDKHKLAAEFFMKNSAAKTLNYMGSAPS